MAAKFNMPYQDQPPMREITNARKDLKLGYNDLYVPPVRYLEVESKRRLDNRQRMLRDDRDIEMAFRCNNPHGVLASCSVNSVRIGERLRTMRYVERSAQHFAVDTIQFNTLLDVNLSCGPTVTVKLGADNLMLLNSLVYTISAEVDCSQLIITMERVENKLKLSLKSYIIYSDVVPASVSEKFETHATTLKGEKVFIRRTRAHTYWCGNASIEPIWHFTCHGEFYHVYPYALMLNDFLTRGGVINVQAFMNMIVRRREHLHSDLRRSNLAIADDNGEVRLMTIDDFRSDGGEYAAINDLYYDIEYDGSGCALPVRTFSNEFLALFRIMADINGCIAMSAGGVELIYIFMNKEGKLNTREYYIMMNKPEIVYLSQIVLDKIGKLRRPFFDLMYILTSLQRVSRFQRTTDDVLDIYNGYMATRLSDSIDRIL
jgi:hypothetical protein